MNFDSWASDVWNKATRTAGRAILDFNVREKIDFDVHLDIKDGTHPSRWVRQGLRLGQGFNVYMLAHLGMVMRDAYKARRIIIHVPASRAREFSISVIPDSENIFWNDTREAFCADEVYSLTGLIEWVID